MKVYGNYGYSGAEDASLWKAPTKSSGAYKACYHTHPTLLIGGGTLYGGSCISPLITDADVYIGLDTGMRVQPVFPWEKETPVQQILFPVTDMCAPSNANDFAKLVEFVCNQLQLGRHVHAGCIGGHGRTGTLFSAVFSVLNNDKDSINTVRKLYCSKAVESSEQISFLHKHFGIAKVEGTKDSHAKGYNPSTKKSVGSSDLWPTSGASEIKKSKVAPFSSAKKVWNCVNSASKAVGILF